MNVETEVQSGETYGDTDERSARVAPPDDGFISRLRMIAEATGSASALVRQAGISPSGFQKYLNGAEPTRRVLIALARAAQVDLQWLMTGQGSIKREERGNWPNNHLTLLPLFRDGQSVSCDLPESGEPEKLVQLAFCREWLGKHGFDPANLGTMRVEGRLMEPTLHHGDTVVVDRVVNHIADGEIYVIQDSESLLIKRLQRQLGGRVALVNDNGMQAPLEARLDEIDIVGKVIWRGALL
ncbi:MAG TPA: S24 family peptidase [Paraburkholderia sp.]|nr:S24 family peptidase [Paraburkholderia sp.]